MYNFAMVRVLCGHSLVVWLLLKLQVWVGWVSLGLAGLAYIQVYMLIMIL